MQPSVLSQQAPAYPPDSAPRRFALASAADHAVPAPALPPVNQCKLRRHHHVNLLQTSIALLSGIGLLCFIAHLTFGHTGLWLSFWFVALVLTFGIEISPQVALALHKAQPLPPASARALHELTARLAQQAGLSTKVRLYYTSGQVLNAFSTGNRRYPCVVVSEGLLSLLSARELAGVVAHELAHLAHGDLKIMVLSHLVGRAVSFFALFGQVLIWLNLPFIINGDVSVPFWFFLLVGLGPSAMQLSHLKLSRVREYHADMMAIKLTGDPWGLSAALRKIGDCQGGLSEHTDTSASPPPGAEEEAPEWLSTHPPTHRRIAKIESTMAGVGAAG